MQHLSPKDLAYAIGVSESSIKRWVDDGSLVATVTPGGHRRIARSEAIRFIRLNRIRVVQATSLGLEDAMVRHAPPDMAGGLSEQLFRALTHDNPAEVRNLLVSAFLEGSPVMGLVDGPIRSAMARIGEFWLERKDGIMVEHRATDSLAQAINWLRSIIPAPEPWAAKAVGGGPEGDPYLLSCLAASAAMAEAGFKQVNLGANTPAETFEQAVRGYRPEVVWLSVSAPMSAPDLTVFLTPIAERLTEMGGLIVVGGRGLPEARPRLPGVSFHDTITDLVTAAKAAPTRPPFPRLS